MGFIQKGFHGSFRDIKSFNPKLGDPEGRFGSSIYITTNPEDASLNYAARTGPDPTGKFQRKIEELQSMKDAGKIPEDADLYELASKEIFGTSAAKASDIGTVYPVRVKTKNPLRLGVSNETFLDFTPKFDRKGEFVSDSKTTEKLAKSLKASGEKYGFDSNQLMADISDTIADGEVAASKLDDALRKSEDLAYAQDPNTGKLVQSEVIRQLYQDLGFDSIVIDAKKTFPKMPNIEPGTEHIMVFRPNQVRSEFAKFDPAKAKSGVITAGGASVALPALIDKMRQDDDGR
jgi:hypothetical protein